MEDVSMQKDDYELAMERFENEFQFINMDTMMYLFPLALRDAMWKNYPYMVEPRFVAIGPYHHCREHLKKMEEVKDAAAYYLCDIICVNREEAMKKVLGVVDEARGKYYLDYTTVDTGFPEMLFRDACFLLLYMDVYDRSYGDEEDYLVNRSMQRFHFSNRDSIERDIMLLENQIPWRVIEALVDLAKHYLICVVERFITYMGHSFTLTDSDDPSQRNKECCGFFKKREESCYDPPPTYDQLNDKNNPPAHLLEVLRRHKTRSKSVRRLAEPRWAKIKAMSPMGLEEIGINLTPSKTAAFSGVYFLKGRFGFSRNLSLPPLFLNETVASCLVNMAALEVCTASRFGDHPDKTAVCSYVALLAFFMIGDEDVRRLRSMQLLEGPHSHADMRRFFTTVAKHLPDRGFNFYTLMGEINEYRSNSYRIAIYKWLYRNKGTIIAVGSIVGTIIGVVKALLSAVQKN